MKKTDLEATKEPALFNNGSSKIERAAELLRVLTECTSDNRREAEIRAVEGTLGVLDAPSRPTGIREVYKGERRFLSASSLQTEARLPEKNQEDWSRAEWAMARNSIEIASISQAKRKEGRV